MKARSLPEDKMAKESESDADESKSKSSKMTTDDDTEIQRLQDSLAESRATLVASTEALADRARTSFDWQTWYRRQPGAFLAAAFVFGLLLGRRS